MRNPSKPVPFAALTESAIRYRAARFLDSVNAFPRLPPDSGREVAFAGRSNAGKSSALNVLTGQRQLARASKTPGRTQLLNFFEVEPERLLVDLPGYGYARVPDAVRRHWQALLERYLRERAALRGLLLLMDIRHPLTELDRGMLDCCAARALPVHVLLTKADKLGRGAALGCWNGCGGRCGRLPANQRPTVLRPDRPGDRRSAPADGWVVGVWG